MSYNTFVYSLNNFNNSLNYNFSYLNSLIEYENIDLLFQFIEIEMNDIIQERIESQIMQESLETAQNNDSYNDNLKVNLNLSEYNNDINLHKNNKFCSICQEQFENKNNIFITNCSHFFHNDCLETWIKYKQFCPNCKLNIPYIQK